MRTPEQHKAGLERARAILAKLVGCEQRWEQERAQQAAEQACVREHQSRARRWVDSLIFKTTQKPTAAEIEEKRERSRKSLERAREVLNRDSTSDQKPGIIYKTYQNSPLTAPVVPAAAVAPAAPASADPDPVAALTDSGAFSSEQVHALGEMLGRYAELMGAECGIIERPLTAKILSVENRQLKSENAVLRRQLEERAADDVVDFNVAKRAIRRVA
jgi:hypothetical protein